MKKNYDKLLKEALYDIKKEEIDLLPSEDVIDYEFSDDFEKKMEKLINGKTEKKKNYGRILKKAAVIIIVIFSALLLSTKADASPDKIFNFFIKIYEDYIMVRSNEPEGTAEIKNKFMPSSLPEGYKIIKSYLHAASRRIVYECNEPADNITFYQYKIASSHKYHSDNQKEITRNGINVLIIDNGKTFEDAYYVYYLWNEQGYGFEISAPKEVDEEIILKNVGNLTLVQNE